MAILRRGDRESSDETTTETHSTAADDRTTSGTATTGSSTETATSSDTSTIRSGTTTTAAGTPAASGHARPIGREHEAGGYDTRTDEHETRALHHDSSHGDRHRVHDEASVAEAEREVEARRHRDEAYRREQYGGFNFGAAFFGWLVAVAFAVLLAGIVGAIAAAVGEQLDVNQTDAERQAGTVGLATGIALLVILMIGYYAGGYVAGRMSRYDGGRQGAGAWLIGVVATLLVVVIGWIFGSQYDVFQRVDLPSIPVPTDTLTAGGLIWLAAVVLGTLVAAVAGGKMGQRYHTKIDRLGV
jgi:hypothetical protein